MNPSRKHMAMGGTLVLTLIAIWQAPEESNAGVALSSHAQSALAKPGVAQARNPGVVASNSVVDVLDIHPRGTGEAGDDGDGRLFAASEPTHKPAPEAELPPQTEALPAPPPQAPALPFRFLGRYDDAAGAVVFLQYMDQNLAVRRGDTVAENYKVDDLQGSTMTFRYLPLDQVQTLEIGRGQ